MAIYFGPVASHCPISRDQPVPGGVVLGVRSTIPHAFDLTSALLAANIARSIVTSVTQNTVINNTHDITSRITPPKDKYKRTRSLWSEIRSQRLKRLYKYFAKTADNKKDPSTWVVMERIERMAWYDRGWNASLVWEYGEKGDDGEPVSGYISS